MYTVVFIEEKIISHDTMADRKCQILKGTTWSSHTKNMHNFKIVCLIVFSQLITTNCYTITVHWSVGKWYEQTGSGNNTLFSATYYV